MVKKFTDAEKFVGSRRQFSTYFKSVSSRLVTSLKSLLEMVLGTQSRRAFGDFGEGSKPRRTEKEEKKLELRLGLRWLDTVFQGQYLPSLSVNYVAINKGLEK